MLAFFRLANFYSDRLAMFPSAIAPQQTSRFPAKMAQWVETTFTKSQPTMEVADIKREVELLSDRLGKTQDYL
ncbi:hypothetical protein POG22_13850 [Geitlerinema sp. CS-897]|nr:hypothetical protein [Geitlerinema sp. CS-897]